MIVLSVTAAMVAVFGLVGFGIGSLLGNTRAGIVIGVFLSYPFTQWTLAKAMMKIYKEKDPIEDTK
jgi:hypothetical protein